MAKLLAIAVLVLLCVSLAKGADSLDTYLENDKTGDREDLIMMLFIVLCPLWVSLFAGFILGTAMLCNFLWNLS